MKVKVSTPSYPEDIFFSKFKGMIPMRYRNHALTKF